MSTARRLAVTVAECGFPVAIAAVLLFDVYGARSWGVGEAARLTGNASSDGIPDGPPVTRGALGAIVINPTRLTPYYAGHYLTTDQIRALQKRGLARLSMTDYEFACHGVDLYVDSTAQIAQWNASMLPRMKVRVARTMAARKAGSPTPYGTGDPCADVPPLPVFPSGG